MEGGEIDTATIVGGFSKQLLFRRGTMSEQITQLLAHVAIQFGDQFWLTGKRLWQPQLAGERFQQVCIQRRQ